MGKRKDSIYAILLFVSGLLFTGYGCILSIMSNLNLGVILVLLFGLCVLLTGIFHKSIQKWNGVRAFRICKRIVAFLLCTEILLVSFLAVFGVHDEVGFSEDAVVVLGAGIRGDKVTLPLKLRLDKAIKYHEKNPDAWIIVSGGQGFQETVTEAYAMEKYLIENGVDETKILKEEKATSTYENMKFSKEILDASLSGEYATVIITNHFHVFRGVSIAKQAGFENVSHVHAGLQWYNLLPCFLRESLAVLKMWIVN